MLSALAVLLTKTFARASLKLFVPARAAAASEYLPLRIKIAALLAFAAGVLAFTNAAEAAS